MDWLDWNILINSSIGTVIGSTFAGLIAYLIYDSEKKDIEKREDYNWRLEMVVKFIEMIEESNSAAYLLESAHFEVIGHYSVCGSNSKLSIENLEEAAFQLKKDANKIRVLCTVFLNKIGNDTVNAFNCMNKYVNFAERYADDMIRIAENRDVQSYSELSFEEYGEQTKRKVSLDIRINGNHLYEELQLFLS